MSYIKARISKIVVPLDGSESAMNAADYALLIAKQSNAELIAIHYCHTCSTIRRCQIPAY
jgi:nucleotide-binding universal stress UspA family protein